jgi:hypothetical protein
MTSTLDMNATTVNKIRRLVESRFELHPARAITSAASFALESYPGITTHASPLADALWLR